MKRSMLTAVLPALLVTGSLFISGTAVYAEAEETADAEYIYEEYDEEYECYECIVNMDEDDMYRYIRDKSKGCPYFRMGDEYKIVQKQN